MSAVGRQAGSSRPRFSCLVSPRKTSRPQPSFSAHDGQDVDLVSVMPIKHATGRLDDLAVAPALQFLRFRAAFRMLGQLVNMAEHMADEPACGFGIVQCNVVCDGVQIAQCRLGPDYFNHRDIRALAWACDTMRPSSMAFSPRAIPSSRLMRRCKAS